MGSGMEDRRGQDQERIRCRKELGTGPGSRELPIRQIEEREGESLFPSLRAATGQKRVF